MTYLSLKQLLTVDKNKHTNMLNQIHCTAYILENIELFMMICYAFMVITIIVKQ